MNISTIMFDTVLAHPKDPIDEIAGIGSITQVIIPRSTIDIHLILRDI